MPDRRGRVQDKVALVTGAGSGIGRVTAGLLASEGAIVVATDIQADAARSCAEEIVGHTARATALELDVSDPSQWRRATQAVAREHGRLDVLVNNAGITISKPISDLSFLEWRKVLEVNLDGVFLGMKHAIEVMATDRGGSIVNVASVSGITPCGGAIAYCTSKAAVRMLSKAAAIECADARNGVRVNTVTPGGVTTAMWEKESFFQALVEEHGGVEGAFLEISGEEPSRQFHSAAEIAQTILYLASDDSAHLSGVEIVVDRGYA